MILFPLTPAGVDEKRTQLYALPDAVLAIQAEAIKADFRNWVISNFSLDSEQLAYLNQINDAAITYFGEQCALCFLHRLPIELIYPEPPAPRYAKWTGSVSSIETAVDNDGHFEVNGSFTFTISYEDV